MPEICRFYGIRIMIYFDDHLPPHFHAEYGEFEAIFSIKDGKMLDGNLPKTAKKLIKEWHKIYKKEIQEVWDNLQNDKVFKKIPPLE